MCPYEYFTKSLQLQQIQFQRHCETQKYVNMSSNRYLLHCSPPFIRRIDQPSLLVEPNSSGAFTAIH
ncbi:hypothetical protein HYC85_015213 [Camellia sinensis]|uniref:Uncharacterized protein n=1 Tax=Camellia sinensis TaxID=4442 RepID=A0A7J7GXJ6_CAMSI|nr:hypothetical protein HYC85_015213 [Camellia sinensis]